MKKIISFLSLILFPLFANANVMAVQTVLTEGTTSEIAGAAGQQRGQLSFNNETLELVLFDGETQGGIAKYMTEAQLNTQYALKSEPNSAFVMPPEVKDYTNSQTFTLAVVPKFIMDVMVFQGSTFSYLQASDYSWTAGTNQITINSPTLGSGDKVKFQYAAQ